MGMGISCIMLNVSWNYITWSQKEAIRVNQECMSTTFRANLEHAVIDHIVQNQIYQNWVLPGVQNISSPPTSIFHYIRASRHPYNEKSEVASNASGGWGSQTNR